MIKQQLFIGAALIAGVAVGYFLKPDSGKAIEAEASTYQAKGAIANEGESATIASLRARIAELEQKLASAQGVEGEALSNAVEEVVKKTHQGPFGGRFDPRKRLEELKKTDPARYAEITNRFEQFRANRQARNLARREFLASIDTSHMSASEKKTHDELQELMEKREQLEEQMHQEDLTDDQRRQIMDEMRETGHQIRELNGQERETLLNQTAEAMGFSGDDAKEITETIQSVIDATESGRGGFGPPPNGAGGAGGGAGGPPPGM